MKQMTTKKHTKRRHTRFFTSSWGSMQKRVRKYRVTHQHPLYDHKNTRSSSSPSKTEVKQKFPNSKYLNAKHTPQQCNETILQKFSNSNKIRETGRGKPNQHKSKTIETSWTQLLI